MTAPVPSSGLSQERLEEIEQRAKAASDAPWFTWRTREGGMTVQRAVGWVAEMSARGSDADAVFIAHARTDIPDLLAEVRRLQTENFAMHAALDAAREETAQAVREERRCCAQIADDEASKSDDIDAGYLSAQRIARKIRSRSHPGETADA